LPRKNKNFNAYFARSPVLCFSAHISVHLSKRETFRAEAIEIIGTRIASTVQLLRNT